MKIEKWLMDGEVPVKTNVTLYRVILYPILVILVAIGIALALLSHSLVISLAIMVLFLLIIASTAGVVWMILTGFDQERFDELLSGRS